MFRNIKAFKAGLCKISQLIDPSGAFIDVNILCQMFEILILECNAIISAISHQWKRELKEIVNDKSVYNGVDEIRKKAK